MIQRLSAPLRDANFRKLIQFLFFWSFASNLAIPFFAIFMLQRLGLPLSWVIGLSILSQLFNILFLRVWGAFADRFGSKGILSLCASLLLLVILGWIFAAMPEKHFLTMHLLVVLHILAGIANAGVTLTVSTIGLKLAPQGESTSYLAGTSLATNLGAGVGPLFGGLLADFFHVRQLNLTFTWLDPVSAIQFPALSIIGHDFLFAIAFIIGLITLGVLVRIREEGEVGREVILASMIAPMREFSQPMSSVPGLTSLSNFPLGFLKRVPIPGLDVAIGVTIYELAEMARVATSAAVHGRRVTKRLGKALESSLAEIWKAGEEVKEHGIEITRQIARGAMHVVSEKRLDVKQIVSAVTMGVVEASSKAGVNNLDGISGTSQGIIQGAAETGTDLGETTLQVIKTAKEIAAQTGLSEESAVAKAVEGVLQAAEAIGPKAAAEVAESVQAAETIGPEAAAEAAKSSPEEILPSEINKDKR
jgi:MFS family permease